MKKNRILVAFLIIATLLSLSLPAYAESPEATNETSLNLNTIDLSAPFSKTVRAETPSGEDMTLVISYTPAPQTRGSSTEVASVGTWNAWMTYGVFSMSYDFDMSHPSGWQISNPRNFITNGSFMDVKERSLTIGRATSTATAPATLTGTALCSVFDNAWVHIYDVTYNLTTSVTNGGQVTFTW